MAKKNKEELAQEWLRQDREPKTEEAKAYLYRKWAEQDIAVGKAAEEYPGRVRAGEWPEDKNLSDQLGQRQ